MTHHSLTCMNPKLSILLPSNRPEGLEIFIKSLKLYGALSVELIILVDDDKNYVEFQDSITTIHRVPTYPVSIGQLQEECYKLAKGKWICLANDDVICETNEWDLKLFKELDKVSDEIGLFWFNDNLFGRTLSCFPVVSRKVLELINFFPTPYRRFKIDDTLFEIFPHDRKFYLENIVFNHKNPNYNNHNLFTIEQHEAAEHDSKLWNELTNWRLMARSIIESAVIRETNHKVLIGVPSGKLPQSGEFYDHLNFLNKPNGTFLTIARGQSPAHGRNLIIEQALATKCTHILFLDDDMLFQSDLLNRLLAHDKDIVSALYLGRNYPHYPIVFQRFDENKHAIRSCLESGETGIIPIVAAGLGACLIKTSVFESMEKPYIRLGELDADQWCDDIGFFGRVNTVDVWCDLDCHVGHATQMTIWPTRTSDGKWLTTYDTRGEQTVSTPQPVPADSFEYKK